MRTRACQKTYREVKKQKRCDSCFAKTLLALGNMVALMSSSSACVEQAVGLMGLNKAQMLLERNASNIRLARAIVGVGQKRNESVSLAESVLERDVVGIRVRKQFASFSWRKRSVTTGTKEKSFKVNVEANGRKDTDSFVPIGQYIAFAAAALGAVAIGWGIYYMIKKNKQ
jgi:hypothetical protein